MKRKCSLKGCKAPATAFSSLKAWCSPEHGAMLAEQLLAKQKAKKEKEERKELKARKEAAMPMKKHLKLTEAVMNKYACLRDYHDGCCSCFKPSHWDGIWHASHYKSVGSNSLLRFHLWNINKGCSECNLFKSGNLLEYEKRLRLKIGDKKVEWLNDHKNASKEYTAEYLIRMRRIFAKKCRRMEKRLGLKK